MVLLSRVRVDQMGSGLFYSSNITHHCANTLLFIRLCYLFSPSIHSWKRKHFLFLFYKPTMVPSHKFLFLSPVNHGDIRSFFRMLGSKSKNCLITRSITYCGGTLRWEKDCTENLYGAHDHRQKLQKKLLIFHSYFDLIHYFLGVCS